MTNKITSFDVGIKNMAYCLFAIDSSISILDWNVLNLMNEEEAKNICTCIIPPKTKKVLAKPCNKNAKYKKNGDFYCEKHAKACSQFILPTKQTSPSFFKKMKAQALFELCKTHRLFLNIENPEKLLKKDMLDMVLSFYENQCFEPIVLKKVQSASQIDLINIGRNMQTCLDRIASISDINYVIIENQISPIANRMKTIQGMLAQYFIMKAPQSKIEFVSSANKLKQFQKKTPIENTMVEIEDDGIKASNYKKNKSDGIKYCKQIMDANPCFQVWKDSLHTKKKDDLADCFLQGIWYIQTRNLYSGLQIA